MNKEQPASHRASEADTLNRRDEVATLVRCFALPPTTETGVQRRWNGLTQRIVAHRYLQALNAHMTVQGSEVRRSALLLRSWSSLAVPIA